MPLHPSDPYHHGATGHSNTITRPTPSLPPPPAESVQEKMAKDRTGKKLFLWDISDGEESRKKERANKKGEERHREQGLGRSLGMRRKWGWASGGVQSGQWIASSRRKSIRARRTLIWKTEEQWRQVAAKGTGTIFAWTLMGSSPRTQPRPCNNRSLSTGSGPTCASKDFTEELGIRVPLPLQLKLSALNTAVSTPQGKTIASYEFAVSDHPWSVLTQNEGRGETGFTAAWCKVPPVMGVSWSMAI